MSTATTKPNMTAPPSRDELRKLLQRAQNGDLRHGAGAIRNHRKRNPVDIAVLFGQKRED